MHLSNKILYFLIFIYASIFLERKNQNVTINTHALTAEKAHTNTKANITERKINEIETPNLKIISKVFFFKIIYKLIKIIAL